jgi:hypothetical protein
VRSVTSIQWDGTVCSADFHFQGPGCPLQSGASDDSCPSDRFVFSFARGGRGPPGNRLPPSPLRGMVVFVRACVLGFSEWRGKEWKDGSRQVDTCVSYPATSARPCIWEGQRTDWRPLPTMPKCCAAETASLPWEGEEKVRGFETSRLPPRQRSMRVFACMCAQNSLWCVHICAYVVYMRALCKAHEYMYVKVQQRQSETRG